MEQRWIPIEEQIPKEDEYILLSFENFSIPVIGRFENGAFYAGDEDESLVKQDMHVNAWMPLPEPYRKMGALTECRTAVEKQTPKKPDLEGDGYADGHLVYDTWICPCCGKRYEIDYEEYDYCPNCGQHIDWSNEE